MKHLFTFCIGVSRKFHAKACLLFYWFLMIKSILKALFSFISSLLNSSDLPSYGSNSRKRYILRLQSMCLGRSTPPPSHSIPSSIPLPLYGLLFTQLYIYVLAKTLPNGLKFIQKLTPCFKTYMKNLDNSRQAVETPESWNLLGYSFPKIDSFS